MKYKDGMKLKVVGALSLVGLSYVYFILPEAVVTKIEGNFGNLFGHLAKVVGGVGGASIFAFVLFASDSLFQGNGPAAEYVRCTLPSQLAKDTLKCSEATATAIWFRYFETWAHARSTNHMLLVLTYQRTYGARMVFYLERALGILIVITIITMSLNAAILNAFSGKDGPDTLIVQLLTLLAYCGGFVFLVGTNRLGKGTRRATGCWGKLREVFDQSRAQFSREVLAEPVSESVAHARIDAIRDQLGREE